MERARVRERRGRDMIKEVVGAKTYSVQNYVAIIDIRFKNGQEKIFDVTPYLGLGKFAELKDISLFNSVAVKFDSIEWANHVDLDPEFLYEHSTAIGKRTASSRGINKKPARQLAR